LASWTTPVIHSTGEILAVSDWNGIANNETFLYQAPYIYAYNTVSTACAVASFTTVTLVNNASNYGWSIGSNSLLFAPITGLYYSTGVVRLATAGSTGQSAFANLGVGGTLTQAGNVVPLDLSVTSSSTVSGLNPVTAGGSGFIYMAEYQDNATPIATQTGTGATWLSSFFVGSL